MAQEAAPICLTERFREVACFLRSVFGFVVLLSFQPWEPLSQNISSPVMHSTE